MQKYGPVVLQEKPIVGPPLTATHNSINALPVFSSNRNPKGQYPAARTSQVSNCFNRNFKRSQPLKKRRLLPTTRLNKSGILLSFKRRQSRIIR